MVDPLLSHTELFLVLQTRLGAQGPRAFLTGLCISLAGPPWPVSPTSQHAPPLGPVPVLVLRASHWGPAKRVAEATSSSWEAGSWVQGKPFGMACICFYLITGELLCSVILEAFLLILHRCLTNWFWPVPLKAKELEHETDPPRHIYSWIFLLNTVTSHSTFSLEEPTVFLKFWWEV